MRSGDKDSVNASLSQYVERNSNESRKINRQIIVVTLRTKENSLNSQKTSGKTSKLL